ncbi:hypothetical protein EYC80_004980 [Monilinia laxa]|uniref:40S ribosomal protein S15 n=1 Tax=Monilinia laxa TaxID=61186 RepID=A0A5N6KJ22_MONLA|nr:hypothetical protein EYC80_004980 [Monilinia laxa]
MADEEYDAQKAAEIKAKRAFRKFSYRGIDLDQLLDLSSDQLRDVVHARARRRFNRGLKRKPMGLIKKLRKAKQEAQPNEKPDLVKTHLRDMIVVPEMIGSVIVCYTDFVESQAFRISLQNQVLTSKQPTSQARKTRYRCYSLFPFHSPQVNHWDTFTLYHLGYQGWMDHICMGLYGI